MLSLDGGNHMCQPIVRWADGFSLSVYFKSSFLRLHNAETLILRSRCELNRLYIASINTLFAFACQTYF